MKFTILRIALSLVLALTPTLHSEEPYKETLRRAPQLPGKGILTIRAFREGLKTGVGADKIPYPRQVDSGRPFATNLHSLLPSMYHFLAAVEFDEGTAPEPLELRLESAK